MKPEYTPELRARVDEAIKIGDPNSDLIKTLIALTEHIDHLEAKQA